MFKKFGKPCAWEAFDIYTSFFYGMIFGLLFYSLVLILMKRY